MAIYNFAGTVLSRSQSRSAIASVAYRSGEKLYDERQNREFNYSRKQDVIFKEILLPPNAPSWMTDREKLWNAVEKAENRKDSQLAREFNFALPREFSKEQNIEISKEFVQDQFVSRGMVADLCIHAGKTKNGAEQPHAHVVLTMRKVTEEGFGLKDRSWNAKENLLLWRESWAEHLNKHLALNGIDQRVDHRSLADQGSSLTAQIKIGSVNLKDHTRRLEEYQRIARENGERLLADPAIALKVITHHQSTFTNHDIARFTNGHTADITQFQAVLEKIKASDQIIALGKDASNTERFTTKEMLALEKKMLADVATLENKGHELKHEPFNLKANFNNAEPDINMMGGSSMLALQDRSILGLVEKDALSGASIPISNFDTVDQNGLSSPDRNFDLIQKKGEPATAILDKITTGFLAMAVDDSNEVAEHVINNTEPKSIINLSSEQKDALEHITNPGDIKCLIGYAGTGKSHILKEARELWEQNGYKVHGATLSGIAAENLEGASGINSRTFASRCYYWDKDRQHLTDKDVLVIDEAGMLGTRQLARAIDEVKTHGAKLVLIGDPQQLQAIEAGAAFRAITTKTSYLELTEVRRQREPWQQAATKEFALRDIQSAFDRYDKHDHIHSFDTQNAAKASLVEMWNDVRIAQPDKTQIILAYTRKEVQELNEIARAYRKQNNELGEDHKLPTSMGNKNFAEGDRIYFLRNNRDLGVMNGTLGNIERIANNRLIVVIDRDDFKGNKVDANRQVVDVDLDYYNYLSHGYAATIHKAQGVTVDRSYLLASKHIDSHATYVGMSRHRESVELFWSKEEFNDDKVLLHTLSRDRSKDIALDYIQDPDNDEQSIRQQQATAAVDASIYETGQPAAEESLESKVNIIASECTKLINSIDYCNTKQEEFIKEGRSSPFLKETLDENKESLRQCLKENCGRDKEMLNYLKQHESKLFNDINRVCGNILTNTIRVLESKELLTNLTKDQSELYNKVIGVENIYKDLRQECIEKNKLLDVKAENWSEYSRRLDAVKDSEKHLEKYAHDLCKDMTITQLVSQYNPELFNEMDKRFNGMFTDAIKQHNLHENFISKIHPEFSNTTLTREERSVKMYEQYKELKQEHLESEQATRIQADDWSQYSQRLDSVREAEEHLSQYTKEACKDESFMNYLSTHDEKTFTEMNEINERFNELAQEQMEEMQHELEKDF